ncbi:hypothetical protein AB0O28_05145 [Microbispora sp. NPDC088329]|uniref:hypothetical protein n=1 Tax=Microbispora sp. NPDC088329 TaxID=3154869 RepID=UPI00343B5D73
MRTPSAPALSSRVFPYCRASSVWRSFSSQTVVTAGLRAGKPSSVSGFSALPSPGPACGRDENAWITMSL